MYILAYQALARRRNRLAIALIWTEVIAHATLGTLLIGWDSGFHYYLLMFIPALFLSMPLRGALAALVSLWAFYLVLDVVMWTGEPLQPISRDALLAVHLFNLSVVFAMFSYLSFFYLKIVSSAQRKLRQMAATDPLTGLIDLAERELARFQRSRHPIGLLLLDIDHFKSINDSHGHEIGDKVLVDVANGIEAVLRSQDLIARWGGEEFLAVLPDTNLEQARASAERVRQALMQQRWCFDGKSVAVTISVGVSEFQEGDELKSAINRADRALYRCKDNGRNRVEVCTGGEVTV
jgi:diguanylate cyclase (GGDEF)-like protein